MGFSGGDELQLQFGYLYDFMQEKLMVNTLQFNMSVPTPYVFMRRFLKAAHSDKKVRN